RGRFRGAAGASGRRSTKAAQAGTTAAAGPATECCGATGALRSLWPTWGRSGDALAAWEGTPERKKRATRSANRPLLNVQQARIQPSYCRETLSPVPAGVNIFAKGIARAARETPPGSPTA